MIPDHVGVAGDIPEYPTERNCPFDPPTDLASYRAHEPIRQMRYPDGQIGWIITSRELARRALSDLRFSARSEIKRAPQSRPGTEPFFGVPALPGWMLDLDPPEHTRIRGQLAGKFTARRMSEKRARLAEIVSELLDQMEHSGPPADLVADFALPFTTMTICEFLGVPYSEHARFQRDSKLLFSLKSTPADAAAAMDRLYVLLRGLPREPGQDGLLSTLTHEGTLEPDEITGLGAFMLSAGHGSVSNSIVLGAYALLVNPGQLAKLRSDPGLVDNAVEELLRYVTAFHFGVPRAAAVDFEFAGQQLKAGEPVTISLPAANRDPHWFTDAPDELDIERRTSGHLAFGHGAHQCGGQSLVRLEMRAALSALVERFPGLTLAVPADEVRVNHLTSPIYAVEELPVSW